MFAVKPRAGIVVHILLIATVLFNAFAPITVAAQSKQELATSTDNESTQQENLSFPIFTQPESREAERPSDVNQNIATPVVQYPQITFIENVGQFDKRIKYVAHAGGATVYFSENAIWYVRLEPKARKTEKDPFLEFEERLPKNTLRKGTNVKLNFPSGNPKVTIETAGKVETTFSYFLGNEKDEQHADVPAWNKLTYKDIYPGMDLEISSVGSVLSWNFVITDSPTFNASNKQLLEHGIKLNLAGQKDLDIKNGMTFATTTYGDIPLSKLYVNGKVASPSVDNKRDLIIIPLQKQQGSQGGVLASLSSLQLEPYGMRISEAQSQTSSNLLIAMLFGGEDFYDGAWGVAAGSDGALFATGIASSPPDFYPEGGNVQYYGGTDAFALKVNADGSIGYLTFIGGDGWDEGYSVKVNSNDEAYLAGYTNSTTFYTSPNAISSTGQGFLVKLSSDGSQILYSTRLGNDANANFASMDIDGNENIYMLDKRAGGTNSSPQGKVYKFTPGISTYEYVYALGSGRWNSLAVGNDGKAYVSGTTLGSNTDVLVHAISNTGTSVYSLSFAGNGYDAGNGVAVDADGFAYVAGSTSSTNLPVIGSQVTARGIGEISYLAVFDPSGSLVYSSYMDVSGYVRDIAIDDQNNLYFTGYGWAYNFPFTDGAVWTGSTGADGDVFALRLTPTILRESYQISYATLIGGSENDGVYTDGDHLAADNSGNVYIVGETLSTEDFVGVPSEGYFYVDYHTFVVKIFTGQTLPIIPSLVTISNGSGDSCMASAYSAAMGSIAGPINTRTGGYDYTVNDISIPTSAGSLTFQREYTSLSVDNPTLFSAGWTHNHDTRLIFPTDPEGQPNTVLFKAHTANKYLFTINGSGTYFAFPGLCATLTQTQGGYVLKDGGQKTYTFDSSGKLLSYTDAEGHAWDYVYNANGKLSRIDADGGAHYLSLQYDAQGRVYRVNDHTGRFVEYHYNANGDLTSADDVNGQAWTYEYHPTLDHFLTRVAAPGDVTVERTEYYPDGKAWKQFDGEENLVAELVYNPDGTTTITDALGNISTHTYDGRGTLVTQENAAGAGQEKVYDYNFRPKTITDGNSNSTNLTWSSDGNNLTKIIDAALGETDITYGTLNNPTNIINPMDYETKYFYTDTNFPTQPTRVEYPLSFDGGLTYIGTDYEYYPPSSGISAGKVKFVTDPLGHQTFYTYTSSGQVESVEIAYGTSDSQTINNLYDNRGNLIEQTDSAGVKTRYEYDNANRLTQVIQNYINGGTPQNYQDKWNIVTEYRYDTRGNQIAVIDTNGVITRTYYDLADRPVTVVQNLTGQTLETVSPPARGSGITDENIRTDTIYNEAGNAIVTYDAQNIITRTYYDEANRQKLVIQNWAGTDLYGGISTAPAYNPTFPDQNVRTEYFYDFNNNLIATKDTLGIYTRTYYDALNRAVTVVQHLTGQDISSANPPGRGSSSNIRTDMYYDANGNVIATVDPKGVVTRTYYDALNRPITVVQNLAGSISNTTPPPAGTGVTESNLRTDTYYDQAGNVIATVDPRGVVTRTYYDSANRPVTMIQNLVGQDIYVTTPPLRGSGESEENARTDIAYDQNGRRDSMTDPLGRVTKYEYDEIGQLIKMTVNYVNGGIPQNDQDQWNIVTEYAYDALGRQIKLTDTLGGINLNSYDDLSRLLSVTQNYSQGQPQNYKDEFGDQYNLITSFTYDVRGSQIAVTDTKNVITRTYYDALGRPVAVARNLLGHDLSLPFPPARANPPSTTGNLLTETVYLGNGSVDYVIDETGKTTDYAYDPLGRLVTVLDPLLNQTGFEYDANGNRTLMTDAEGVLTKYEYDNPGRLSAVVENYRAAIAPDHETNVRTEYTYYADGNRQSILDGNLNLMTFTYTAFGQLETEADALGNGTTYGYNAVGNRTSLLDANGETTIFGYDEMNRLESINYPDSGSDVTFEYDALGRRVSMTDGVGITSWNYNNLDLPKSISDPFAASVLYDYDPLGNRTKLTYPDNRVVDYQYNSLNRLEDVASNGVGNTHYEYDAIGRLKIVERPNGVDTVYNYYDNGWLQDIVHSSGAEILASYQYQYYADGNRSQAVENVQSPGFAYGDSNPEYELASYNDFKFTSPITSGPQATFGGQTQAGQTLPNPQQVDFGRLPLSFIPNMGQFDKDIQYQTNSLGGSIFFMPSEVTLALMDKKIKLKTEESDEPVASVDNSKAVRIEYKNGDKKAVMEGLDLQAGTANFMVGSDPAAWVSNAPMYGSILYRQLYPGVDLSYEGTEGILKSTFTVSPGADPSVIEWRYKGADEILLDEDGDLRITLSAKREDQTDTMLVEHAPVAWQEQDGQRVDVLVQYSLAQNDDISFVFPYGYDASLPLTIDPVLSYSTYLGDIGTDVGTAITTDTSGNVYVTGFSWCGNFPTVDPITGVTGSNGETIISKISADGSSLLYSTCVGGAGDDFGKSIALDTQGRVVVAGETNSIDFPIVSGVGAYGGGTCSSGAPCQDTFILALNSDGSAIRYSTYLGGDGREEVGGIAVDSNGKIVLVGSTTSTNFPAVNAYDSTFAGGTCPNYWPCYDATVTKIDPELSGSNSILYSTYLGGIDHDKAYGVVLDENNIVYLVGYSDSDGYPTRNALQPVRRGGVDIILSQIDTSLTGDASLLYSTYLGSTDNEHGYAIDRDVNGNLYITGRTSSPRFALRDPLQFESHAGSTCNGSTCYEAFVTKLNIAANTIVYSTYLGGSHNDEGYGIAVDSYGRAYVTGFTRSSDFPTFDAIQSAKGGDGCSSTPCKDAFLSVLEPDGQSFAYSTFLGGDQDDTANGITIDSSNNVYLVGETYSTNFPTTPNVLDNINTETNKRDAFITKISALGTPPSQSFLHLDVPIVTANDDAEETNSSGTVSLDSNDLELIRDSSDQTVGLRFAGVDLPQGVVVQHAWIQFRADEATSEATSLTIRAEASDHASAFASTPLNISLRSKTALSVSWSPPAWDTVDEAGPDQRTPDLATLVQEIANRPGWIEGNAMAFILTGSGKRVADSFEEDMHGAAYLHIEYVESSDPPPPSGGVILTFQPDGAGGEDTYLQSSSANTNYGTSSNMGVGENNNATNRFARSLIKFDLSSIPTDAIITSATLSLWTSADYSDNNGMVRVYRLKVPFHETQATWNISSAGVNWQTPGASGANDRESLDIGSVQILSNEPLNTEKQIQLSPEKIQELVNGGFSNNGFILVADTELDNRFDFKTSDTSSVGMRPKLVIEYAIASPQPSGELGLQIAPNPTTFTGAGDSISYTYTLTNIGTVPLNGPYAVSDDTIASVDCSAALSPLPAGQATTCSATYTTDSADVTAGYVTNSATATASDGVQTITSEVATATINYQIPPPPPEPVTIEYFYDPLNRLTEANYSNGDYYHYTYDEVGNRLSQERMILSLLSTDTYMYDDANRIETVNGVTYAFDANGNLLSDGVNTYAYDSANRLVEASNQSSASSYQYNGLGDRLQQTVDGVATNYTLDLNTGLTQVLSDGTNSYLYGNGRIAQVNTTAEYFLADALGSVRQMTNPTGEVTFARTYDPYGVVTQTGGTSQTDYGFTGEQYGDSTQLLYLRARYYNPVVGKFMSRDTWDGSAKRPMTFNQWAYVEDNPINRFDPSGLCSQSGWNDPAGGLFSHEQCEKLENIYLDVSSGKNPDSLQEMQDWYYRLADRIDNDGNLQAATNLRHYLDGTGSQLQLSNTFMENYIWGWDYVNDKVSDLADWYIKTQISSCKPSIPLAVGPDIFATGVDVSLNNLAMWGPWNWPNSNAYGSLASFRLDVTVSGSVTQPWLAASNTLTQADLNLHLTVLDSYDWHDGQSIKYPGPLFGAEIPDDWAHLLTFNPSGRGYGRSFLIRGDIDIPYKKNLWFATSQDANYPPSGWFRASCIGVGFPGGNYTGCAP